MMIDRLNQLFDNPDLQQGNATAGMTTERADFTSKRKLRFDAKYITAT
ncbi:hypothetical protein [Legionella busanensis]|nr:hypothetical protein [Legionella busanensis]